MQSASQVLYTFKYTVVSKVSALTFEISGLNRRLLLMDRRLPLRTHGTDMI